MCECCSNHAKQHEGQIHVNGVNCGHCVGTIEKALSNKPGINALEHLSESKQLRISFDSRLVEVESLKKIIADLGYEVA